MQGANKQQLGDYTFILCNIAPKPGWSLSHPPQVFSHYPQLNHLSPSQHIYLRERLLQYFMDQPTELYPEMGNLLSEIILSAAELITTGLKTSTQSWFWELQTVRRLCQALLPDEDLPSDLGKALAQSVACIHASLVNQGPWKHLPNRAIPHMEMQDCHAAVGKMKRIALHFSLCGRKIRALAFRKNVLLALVRHPAHYYVLKLPWSLARIPTLAEAQHLLDQNPLALHVMGVSGLSKARRPILPWKAATGLDEDETEKIGGIQERFRSPIL